MDEVVVDLEHVVHRRENGVSHNTWCGRAIFRNYGHVTESSVAVTCLECIGGPSHLGIEDLLFGSNVELLVCGYDTDRHISTYFVPVTFEQGTNLTAIAWTGLTQRTIIDAIAFCRLDRTVIHVTSLESPCVIRRDDTLGIEIGRIVLKGT